MPLTIIDGFASTGDLNRVLVLELNLNAATPQSQHEPRVIQRFSVQHYTFWIERPEVKLSSKPVAENNISKKLLFFLKEYFFQQTCHGALLEQSNHSLSVVWKSKVQVDHRLACELLSQVEYLPVLVVVEPETFRDFLTGAPVLCQLQPPASIAVTRVAAHCVYTRAVTFVLLTLVHVCPTHNTHTVICRVFVGQISLN